MNVVIVMSDSLRPDFLGCYGNNWVETPNLDRFAGMSTVFDRAYSGSMPTIPNRTDIHTGYWTMLRRGWSPLPATDYTISDHLGTNGWLTAHFFDTPHLGYMNFQQKFHLWRWQRGQEGDRFAVPGTADSDWTSQIGQRMYDRTRCRCDLGDQHLANNNHRTIEDDYCSPRTFTEAIRFVEDYHDRKFFLMVDTFDPHEPWDPPLEYVKKYDPDYDGHEPIVIPAYQYCDDWAEAQIRHTRARYAGEVAMVDKAFGRLLDTVQRHGILDDTLIMFMSDHGHFLGEHGRFGKANRDKSRYLPGDERYNHSWPFHREISRIALMVHLPGTPAARTGALVQPVDFFPTICDATDLEVPETVEGTSFRDVLVGSRSSHREVTITSARLGGNMMVTDGSWAWHHLPSAKTDLLFNLSDDPKEEHNILDTNKKERDHLKQLCSEHFTFSPEAAQGLSQLDNEQ